MKYDLLKCTIVKFKIVVDMENKYGIELDVKLEAEAYFSEKVLLMERRFFADMTKNHRRTIILNSAVRLTVINLIELLEEIKLMASVS